MIPPLSKKCNLINHHNYDSIFTIDIRVIVQSKKILYTNWLYRCEVLAWIYRFHSWILHPTGVLDIFESMAIHPSVILRFSYIKHKEMKEKYENQIKMKVRTWYDMILYCLFMYEADKNNWIIGESMRVGKSFDKFGNYSLVFSYYYLFNIYMYVYQPVSRYSIDLFLFTRKWMPSWYYDLIISYHVS